MSISPKMELNMSLEPTAAAPAVCGGLGGIRCSRSSSALCLRRLRLSSPFGMKRVHQVLLLLACAILGCKPGMREQDLWAHMGDGPAPDYYNFYEEFAKYPAYAIAEYPINEAYDRERDLKYLRDSLRLCRASFATAYRAGKLLCYNPKRLSIMDPNWKASDETPALIPFKPVYLVVAIRNVAEHKGASTFATSYKVAYIVPIARVLGENYDFEEVARAAYMDRDPFYFDAPSPEAERNGWSPAERYKWLAIERHQAKLKIQSTVAGGAANQSQPVGSDTNRTSSGAGSGG